MKAYFVSLLTYMLLTFHTAGCGNFFGGIDKPSGNTQLLSAARAAVDRGDFASATKYYSQLYNTSVSDTALVESIFTVLDQNGLSMGAFITAFASAASSKSFVSSLTNQLAGILTYQSPGQTLRLTFFKAYQQSMSIQNSTLQVLAQLISTLGLMAEILAETAQRAGVFKQSDLVSNPINCINGVSMSTSCTFRAGSPLISGTAIPIQATTDHFSGQPSLYMFNQALIQVIQAVSKLNTSGAPLDSSSNALNQALSAASSTISLTPHFYLAVMIELGIGLP